MTAVLVPRAAGAEPTEFGFTVSSSSDEHGSWQSFTEDVDTVATSGQSWVRLGIASWLVAPTGSRSVIAWDQRALAVYDREVDYIRSRGLRLFLVTSGAPDWTQDYSFEDYVQVSGEYWSYLAQRFASRSQVWQVFNEADTGHFRTYATLDRLPAEYLSQLRQLLGTARSVVHAANGSVVVTTNSTGYPLDDRRESAWSAYFSAIAGSLDAITLDLYPTNDPGEIVRLTGRVTRTEDRFDLPVLIGEVGLQTCQGCYSEQAQGRYVAAAIDALRSARPRMILVYEMRDGGPDVTDGESTFGIVGHDGRRKAGYEQILAQMQDPDAKK